MKNYQPSDSEEFIGNLKNGIWLFGITSWLFGITDRSIASLADGYLSALDLMQLFTASTFFVAWIFLKPGMAIKSANLKIQNGNLLK